MILLSVLCVAIYALAYSNMNYSRSTFDQAQKLEEECKSYKGNDWSSRCDPDHFSKLHNLYDTSVNGSVASEKQATISGVLLLLMLMSLVGRWIYTGRNKSNVMSVEHHATERVSPDYTGQQQPQRQERDCPFCAERILLAAKVCRFCGRDVHDDLVDRNN